MFNIIPIIYFFSTFLIISINLTLPRLNYDTKEIPKYKINLDLPVKERYKEILIKYKEKVKVYAYVTSYISGYLTSKYSKFLINKSTQDPEWVEYIEAVSLYTGISLSEAVLLSITYDLACTSVVINDNSDNILIGRNLDFQTYFVIAHLMIDIEYYKHNELYYRGVELVGFRGAINAIKFGKFSTSLNLRRNDDTIIEKLLRIYQGHLTPNFYLMKVLESAESYDQAIEMLTNSVPMLSSPVYYIVSGVKKNQGSVISRNFNNVYAIDKLDVDKGKWYLVICNTDLDKEESDTDYRRIPTENNIKQIGKENVNYFNLFDGVMSKYPTNNLITAYTTIQSVQIKNSYFNTTIWAP